MKTSTTAASSAAAARLSSSGGGAAALLGLRDVSQTRVAIIRSFVIMTTISADHQQRSSRGKENQVPSLSFLPITRRGRRTHVRTLAAGRLFDLSACLLDTSLTNR